MSKLSDKICVMVSMLLLSACQASTSRPAPLVSPQASPQPSATPTPLTMPTAVSSPAPTAVPIDGQNLPPAFSTSPASLCFGETMTIKLERSNLNRGKILILLQVPPDTSQIAASEIRPVRDIPTDPVVLGEMDVSPIGTGQFSFTLAQSYTTKSGAKVSLPNTFVSLYAETSPGTYSRINDLKICPPPAPTPLPGQRPTPTPDTTPVMIPTLEMENSAFKTQEVYAFTNNQVGYDFSLKLLNGLGFILWRDPNISTSTNDRPAGGRLIRGLELGASLAVQDFPGLSAMDVYFNQMGDGFFSWSSAAGKFLTPMKNLLPAGEPQTISESAQQVVFDESGYGNLYFMRASAQNPWQLWRYLIEGFRTTGQALQVANLPHHPRQIVLDAQGTGFVQTARDLNPWPETPFENQIIEFKNHQQTDSWNLLERYRPEIEDFSQGQGTLLFKDDLQSSSGSMGWSVYPVQNFKLEASHRLFFSNVDQDPAAIKINPDGNGLYALRDLEGLRVRRIKNFQPEGSYYRLDKETSDTSYSVKIELDALGNGLIVWQKRALDPQGTQSNRTPGHLLMRPIKNYQTW